MEGVALDENRTPISLKQGGRQGMQRQRKGGASIREEQMKLFFPDFERIIL